MRATIGLAAIVLFCGCGRDEPAAAPNPWAALQARAEKQRVAEEKQREIEAKAPIVVVRMEDLAAAYERNEFDADERFDGKRLVLTGQVQRRLYKLSDMVYDNRLDYAITLGTYDFSVCCFIGKRDARAFKDLAEGDECTVVGHGWSARHGGISGRTGGGLSECKLKKEG